MRRSHGDEPAAAPASGGRGTPRPLAVVLLALASAPAAAGPGLAMEPSAACALLEDQGLAARSGYSERHRGLFECATVPQRWPRGATTSDAVRFAASGKAGRVSQLRLELSLRSPGDVRPVLAAFALLADTLSMRALGQPLPLEARQATAAGVPGTWGVAGAELALERITGAEPALRFVIR